jgi:hypothetical protein
LHFCEQIAVGVGLLMRNQFKERGNERKAACADDLTTIGIFFIFILNTIITFIGIFDAIGEAKLHKMNQEVDVGNFTVG